MVDLTDAKKVDMTVALLACHLAALKAEWWGVLKAENLVIWMEM